MHQLSCQEAQHQQYPNKKEHNELLSGIMERERYYILNGLNSPYAIYKLIEAYNFKKIQTNASIYL